MKEGTPGFISDRLKQGREARGLTAISLAEILGISRQAVSLYEAGSVTPQPNIMQGIVEKLNLPMSFFLTPIRGTNSRAVYYRSMHAATKLDRARGDSRIEWLSEIIVPYLRSFVSFPEANVPSFGSSSSPVDLSEDSIEDIARDVRSFWGLGDGPISNVVLLLENNGVIFSRLRLYSATLDAFSTWSSIDNTPYIVLGDDKQSAVRSRFDAAHELGHLVLHRTLNKARLNNRAEFKLIEQQANRFAAAFLLPRSKFADDYSVPTLSAFQALKSKWLVSIGVMIRRVFDLGFVSEEHTQRLWINYNRRGWRTQEPLDNRIPLEHPVLLRRACQLILDEKIRSPEQILADIPLTRKDIEELLNVPIGFLKPTMPNVRLRGQNQSINDDYQAVIQEVEQILNNPGSNKEDS